MAVQRQHVRDVLVRPDDDDAARRAVDAAQIEDIVGLPGRAEDLLVVDRGELPLPPAVVTVAESAGTWPVQRDQVAVSPTDGQITETVLYQDWPVKAKLTRIGILALLGSLFGLFSQLCLAAMALGLLAMLFWGYRMWWQRQRTRGGIAGPMAPRGVARALSQPTTLALVLGTVFLGWSIPLFGIILLAFLVVDGLLGALSRRRTPRAAP